MEVGDVHKGWPRIGGAPASGGGGEARTDVGSRRDGEGGGTPADGGAEAMPL
uniref:p0028E10.15 protein n=1 Tax=Oryza sativa subsp. japonica TaxID=39947 RepID=Q9AS77_ORYSJ|nr:P0028E10.15 [Oryza sativa Japonica Group]